MIHQYQLNGYNIVLDIFSGAVHIVDDLAYDMIALYETTDQSELIAQLSKKYSSAKITSEDIRETIQDIETLKQQGKLFTTDDYTKNITDIKKNNTEIKALCLHAAHTCNLTCDYCFASQGKYDGERSFMSLEVGKQALDFLIAHSGNRRNLEVDFFGGEPLMNWDTVKQLVGYAREQEKKYDKNFRFTLTTNGILLDDEVMEFANREMHNVVLSLDGRKEIHDRLRKTVDGRGSYDMIVPKFQKFAASRNHQGYYVRGTFTHFNTDFTKDILHMADLGFTQLSMEPVVCHPSDPYALTAEDLPILFEQYEILAQEMLRRFKQGRGFTFYHYMIDLSGGPCIYKRIAGCGSGTEYLAVTPQGELFPCHQFVGDPHYCLGNVWEGVKNNNLREEFAACNVYSRPQCRDCWAQLYCSGGCAANAYHAAGSIQGVYDYGCELFKKRMECAIMIEAAKAGI